MTQDVLSYARISASSGFGLSPTEARSAGGPKFICVDTEARSEIRQTTSGAPTDASNPPAITTPTGYTDARKEFTHQACSLKGHVLTKFHTSGRFPTEGDLIVPSKAWERGMRCRKQI